MEGGAGHADRCSRQARQDVRADDLVDRAQNGDGEAFEELYRLYAREVRAYLAVALRDGDEACDAMQDVMLSVLQALPTYTITGVPFRAWLFRVARNHALTRLGRRRRESKALAAALLGLGSAVTRAEGRDAGFWALIEHLPATQRRILALSFVLDLSPLEIAGVLGCSPNAVRIAKHRAIRSLRRGLDHGASPQEAVRDPSRGGVGACTR